MSYLEEYERLRNRHILLLKIWLEENGAYINIKLLSPCSRTVVKFPLKGLLPNECATRIAFMNLGVFGYKLDFLEYLANENPGYIIGVLSRTPVTNSIRDISTNPVFKEFPQVILRIT